MHSVSESNKKGLQILNWQKHASLQANLHQAALLFSQGTPHLEKVTGKKTQNGVEEPQKATNARSVTKNDSTNLEGRDHALLWHSGDQAGQRERAWSSVKSLCRRHGPGLHTTVEGRFPFRRWIGLHSFRAQEAKAAL